MKFMRAAIVITISAAAQPALPQAKKQAPDPLVVEAMAAVSNGMKDPSSTQFKEANSRGVTNLRGAPMKVVCGQVNSKNSFGGYVGFQPFIYLPDLKISKVLGPDRDVATIEMLKNFCG